MLFSIAIILLVGFFFAEIFQKLHLPALVGMLFAGILIGPYAGNLLSQEILKISPDIRQIALIIILTRAGLSLRWEDLKRVGRPAILLSFLPATAEIIGYWVLAPRLLSASSSQALLMGSVLAAVSPAVVVPKMLDLMDKGYGTKQGIPQMILAGSSLDDIYVIVLFTTFLSMVEGNRTSVVHFMNIPLSIIFGVILGYFVARILIVFFHRTHLSPMIKAVIVLCVSFLLVTAENTITTPIRFSALISVMVLGMTIFQKEESLAAALSTKYNRLWDVGQIFLFVLVGATVNISYALKFGFLPVLLIFGCLLFRMLGVFCCLFKTPYSKKERFFIMGAYIPKATVQAAIGAVPLSMHLSCGPIILTVAVLGILITAPVGAFFIDISHRKLLQKET